MELFVVNAASAANYFVVNAATADAAAATTNAATAKLLLPL